MERTVDQTSKKAVKESGLDHDLIDEQVVAEFEKELAAARRQADEAQDKYLRTLAEVDNIRKRVERNAESRIGHARRELLLRFLPVVDNLERALQHGDAEKGLREGVELTHRDLMRALSESGVQRLEPQGEMFDPSWHEAIEVVEAKQPSGTIVDVVRPGYTLDEQLVRPAQVRVVK
jgi:molecular chaperone GrpE